MPEVAPVIRQILPRRVELLGSKAVLPADAVCVVPQSLYRDRPPEQRSCHVLPLDAQVSECQVPLTSRVPECQVPLTSRVPECQKVALGTSRRAESGSRSVGTLNATGIVLGTLTAVD